MFQKLGDGYGYVFLGKDSITLDIEMNWWIMEKQLSPSLKTLASANQPSTALKTSPKG